MNTMTIISAYCKDKNKNKFKCCVDQVEGNSNALRTKQIWCAHVDRQLAIVSYPYPHEDILVLSILQIQIILDKDADNNITYITNYFNEDINSTL